MATIKLSNGGGFSLIPEGTHTFKVTEIDQSKYEDFGKLAVKMRTSDGKTHTEFFNFIKSNGQPNDGVTRFFSAFAHTCLDNWEVEEIDPDDLVGCYVTAEITHETFTKRDGSEGTSERMGKFSAAVGYPEGEGDAEDDLDDFLNE